MKISIITQRKNELIDRVLSEGYNTTERDVAEAQELVNQYIDELERLENTATVYQSSNIEIVQTFAMIKWYGSNYDGNL
jgi:hypothetical protein